MSEPSKTKGNLNAAGGAIKENIGYALGNERMQANGAAKRAEGNAEYETAKAQGYAEGVGNKIKGHVKDTAGSLLGNAQMQAEGKGDKLKGEAKKVANQ